MISAKQFALLSAIGCAASALVHATAARAAEDSRLVATTGSVFMSDVFTSTGPAGTFWQPLNTRQDAGSFRYELSVLRQIRAVQADTPASASPLTAPGTSVFAAPTLGSTALSVTYTLPVDWGFRTTVTAKRYLSSSYQKVQLGVPDYDSLMLKMNGNVGRSSVESGLGYKFKKRLAGYEVRNGVYGYVGGAYDLRDASVELFLDFQQSTFVPTGYTAEVSAKFVRSIGKDANVELYVTRGVTPGNRDLATGLFLSLGF